MFVLSAVLGEEIQNLIRTFNFLDIWCIRYRESKENAAKDISSNDHRKKKWGFEKSVCKVYKKITAEIPEMF